MTEETTEDWRVSAAEEDPLVASSRREMKVVLGFWLVFAVWTVLACWWLGYRGSGDGDTLRLVFGMPSWVFWGVAVPWLASMLFTIWFATSFMKDHDLDRDRPDAEEETELRAETERSDRSTREGRNDG